MFAIAFDMVISDLKEFYGEPYNNAYYEIKIVLREYNFYNAQGSVYICETGDMANLFNALTNLKKLEWFRKSVRDIRAFKIEDWSDFTEFIKQ